MWIDTKADVEENSRTRASRSQRVMSGLLLCTGDMKHVDKYMHDKQFVLQLAVWGLRGVARVILANNPLSGALILAALFWDSPWQGLLGTLGVLASTLTAVIIGQDSAEVEGGLHGFNGMLVSLLMGVFSSAGPWYWWLLLPVCFGSAMCVFLFSGLSSVLDRWDLPVSVFPFNTIIVLYLLCTGPDNPYFPHHPAAPPGMTDHNGTELIAVEKYTVPASLRWVRSPPGSLTTVERKKKSIQMLRRVVLPQSLRAVQVSSAGTLKILRLRVASSWVWVRSLPVELCGPPSSSSGLFCSTHPCWPLTLCWDRQWERWLVYPWRCVMNLCTQACQGLMDPWAAWLLEDSSSPSAGGHTSLPSPAPSSLRMPTSL
uniref:Urea transporter n=1 Tax=Gasterosteus aculeatus aculeatus TaxID=481459 RepID=G3Q8Q7_GASAC|nr:urea transporter 2 isoform X3 [Gasterosteus aculeatus aculeatus]